MNKTNISLIFKTIEEDINFTSILFMSLKKNILLDVYNSYFAHEIVL